MKKYLWAIVILLIILISWSKSAIISAQSDLTRSYLIVWYDYENARGPFNAHSETFMGTSEELIRHLNQNTVNAKDPNCRGLLPHQVVAL